MGQWRRWLKGLSGHRELGAGVSGTPPAGWSLTRVSTPNPEAPIPAPLLPGGPPWPQALDASASPGSPPGSCSSPLPAPRPLTRALIHSAPTSSPSPASPVPLTPLGAILSVTPDPGAERRGHTVSPGTPWALSAPAPGLQCHVGTVVRRPGPQQPPCCRNLSGARTCGRRALQVTSCCGSPRALLLLSRSPALEAPTRALGGLCWSRSCTFY